MAVVFCLPISFSPLSPSPSLSTSSSSSSLPSSSAAYSYSGAALNCRFRSDVMCEAGPAMTIASSSAASSFVPPGVTRSPNFCSAAAPSVCSQAGGGGKVHVYTGRLLSSSSSIAYRKNKGRNGFAFGEWSRVRSIDDQKGEGRWKASPAKDSSRDVLTDPAEASRQRLTITRSGEEQQEEGDEGELSEGKGILSERERLLKTDSLASEEEVSPATAASPEKAEDGGFGNTAAIGTVAAGLGLVIVLGGFGTVGYLYKDQLNEFLIQFSEFIEGYGPAGYGLFVLVYAGLEILAIPAIPLTMSAGLLFGAAIGTIIVSIAGTIAATGAFLIARYLARDRLLAFVKGNKKFLAIDKAIGDDGFRVVTLLRLSPLLPFSLGNYLYGLTSVQLGPYVLGSWLGMLPGSWAYVSAGAISRSFITKSENEQLFSGGPEQWWTLGLGLAATVLAATYVTKIAKEALKDIEE